MPASDDSPPPSKKRKTITTYGSQSVLGRALRAVKSAVPATLLSADPEAPDNHAPSADEAGGLPSVLQLQTQTPELHGSGPKQRLSSKMNGLRSPALEPENHASDDPPSSQRETRASKRAHHNGIDTAASTPRKRRKHGAAAGLQDREALSSPVQRVASTVSTSAGYNEQYRLELNDVEDQGSVSTKKRSSHRHNNDQPSLGAPPNEISQRKLRGRPERDKGSSTKKSTKRDSGIPETPSGTPRRKRAGPRIQPGSSPTSPDAEENEMGFRKITKDEGPSSSRVDDASRNGRIIPRSQQPSNAQADVQTVKKDRDNHRLPAKAAKHKHGRGVPENDKSRPHSKDPSVQIPPEGDIFDVSVESETPDQKLSKTLQKSTARLQKLLKTSPANSLDQLKSQILNSLTGKDSHLVNLEEESRKVHRLITQTVLAGEGNSMLVIGPRGCGKTALVESVVTDLALEHKDDFIVIRLSGFIHTDDKLALREIWRQLGREVAAEDEATGTRTNYADTLTSLLALLAHSSEDEAENETARAVVFVIDEFDLFATHPRQTLLYNLFDVAQSRNAPIAVLGLTTRIDVVESLEKRVKSRFGQRYIYLSHPKSFQCFKDMCRSALTSRERSSAGRMRNDDAKLQQLRATWNEYVDALFARDIQLDKFLKYLFAHSNSVAHFKSSMLLSISLLGPSNIPTGESMLNSSLPHPDSKLQVLPSLSDLELALLISAARLDVILDTNMCDFKMVYDEYVQLASRVKLQSNAAGQMAVGGGARVWGKDVAKGAWERLMDLELILTANSAGSRNSGNSVGVMCKVDVALEEIGPNVPRMAATMSKWCKEI
ncbi:MAG: hypothetical protein Q9168_006401 [Polycauliona sp. 1 TL-2023]